MASSAKRKRRTSQLASSGGPWFGARVTAGPDPSPSYMRFHRSHSERENTKSPVFSHPTDDNSHNPEKNANHRHNTQNDNTLMIKETRHTVYSILISI